MSDAIERVRARLARRRTHCWQCDEPTDRGDLIRLCSEACEVEWRRRHPPLPTLRADQCACGLLFIPSLGERACHRLVAS